MKTIFLINLENEDNKLASSLSKSINENTNLKSCVYSDSAEDFETQKESLKTDYDICFLYLHSSSEEDKINKFSLQSDFVFFVSKDQNHESISNSKLYKKLFINIFDENGSLKRVSILPEHTSIKNLSLWLVCEVYEYEHTEPFYKIISN